MAQITKCVGAGTAGNTTGTYVNGTVVTVPTGEFWIPRSIHLIWVTSAVVGNRQASVLMKDASATIYGQVIWLPTQAASLTRNYSAWEGATSSAAFAATSYAQAALARDAVLPSGFTITAYDAASVNDGTRLSFAANTISSITATTVVATSSIFGGADSVKGYTLTMGASTAVITGNDGTTLTFSGGWVGGTPGAAAYYLQSDTVAMSIAYDLFKAISV